MASSFVSYRGKGFWESDGWIRDVLALLLEELDKRGQRKVLRELWEHWTLQSNVILTDSHDLGLDDYVVDEPTRKLVIECCEAVAKRTGKVERRKPKDFDHADRELFEGRERFIEVDEVRPLARQLAKLLRGEVTDDENSPGARNWREREAAGSSGS